VSVIGTRSNAVVLGQYAKVSSRHLHGLIRAMPIEDVGCQKNQVRCIYRDKNGTRPDESHGPGEAASTVYNRNDDEVARETVVMRAQGPPICAIRAPESYTSLNEHFEPFGNGSTANFLPAVRQ
jgi:hypothetical protein